MVVPCCIMLYPTTLLQPRYNILQLPYNNATTSLQHHYNSSTTAQAPTPLTSHAQKALEQIVASLCLHPLRLCNADELSELLCQHLAGLPLQLDALRL
jgi:hypothetical protein